MHLEARIRLLDQANEPNILHNGGVHTAIDRLAEKDERVRQLGWLEENVERQVNAPAALVRQAAGFANFVERELRPFVARVEALAPQVDGIGAIGERRANGIHRASGSE